MERRINESRKKRIEEGIEGGIERGRERLRKRGEKRWTKREWEKRKREEGGEKKTGVVGVM